MGLHSSVQQEVKTSESKLPLSNSNNRKFTEKGEMVVLY